MRKIVESVIQNAKELARVQMLMTVMNVFMLKTENIVLQNVLIQNTLKMEFVLIVMNLVMVAKDLET